MSKVGRNRKGRGHGATPTGWKPAEVTGEVRYEVIRKKSVSGVEHVTYKPVTFVKKQEDEGGNRAFRRAKAKKKR